ncbi:MAG: hypothetical protein AAFN77_23485 [Planctomycetota bacterium]
MRILFLLSILVLAVPGKLLAQDAVPKFFTNAKTNSAELASAVNHFVELGEQQSAEVLRGIADSQTFSNEIDLQFRVACVARIVWQNARKPVAPPSLGLYGGGVTVDSGNQAEWPLFPVAKSGDSYFIVVHGGRGGTGTSANLGSYINKCRANGTFLVKKIKLQTSQQCEADAKSLRQSKRWTTEFPDKSDDETTWNSIRSQILVEAS